MSKEGGFFNPFKYLYRGIQSLFGVREYGSPSVRKFFEENGNKVIKSMHVNRQPINKVVDKIVNYASFGKWSSNKKALHYDDMFHLYMIIILQDRKKYYIEKNHVVEIEPYEGHYYGMAVPLNGRKITMNELFANTEKSRGASKMWNYNYADNNCQVFIKSLLDSNGLLTKPLEDFIMQDAIAVTASLPWVTRTFMSAVIELASRGDIILHGKALKLHMKKYNR